MSLTLMTAALLTQAPITLKFQPKVGTTYKQQVTTTSSGGPMGNAKPVQMTSTSKVVSLVGGIYTVDVSVVGAKNPVNMTMKLTSTGEVKSSDMKGASAGMNSMMSGNSGLGVSFPKKPIKIGESWTQTVDAGKMMKSAMKAGGPQASGMNSTGTIKTTYTLKGVSGGKATIAVKISGDIDMGGTVPGGKDGKAQTMSMKMGIMGTGEQVVEVATGIPVSGNMKQNMTMNMMGQPMNMVMTVSSKRI